MKNREEKKKFVYKKLDPAKIRQIAKSKGSLYDTFIKDGVPVLQLKSGSTKRLRILPPTWHEAEQFAYYVWVHQNIGPDGGKYPCQFKHKQEECTLCNEQSKVSRTAGDDEQEKKHAYELKAKKKAAMWVIDRDDEEAGPQVWAPSWQTEVEVCGQAFDEDNKEALDLVDPEEGHDISFKVGEDKFKKLSNYKVSSRPKPLSDDPDLSEKWLSYITKNPIPSVIKFYDNDYIKKVAAGAVSKDDDDDDKDTVRTRNERRKSLEDEDETDDDDDNEDERPSKSVRKRVDTSRKPKREEDEDDEPPRNKRKVRDEEEDEDDDDYGDNEDELD